MCGLIQLPEAVSFSSYTDLKEKGLGAFYHDPARAEPARVHWN